MDSCALYLDLTHTSHTRARTGVQRVARALETGLRESSVPVCFDPFEGAWRALEPWETQILQSSDPAKGRGAHWPLAARVRGRMRWLRQRPEFAGIPVSAQEHERGGLIMPEIFSADVAAALPRIFERVKGPRVAVFHDAVALQYPEFAPRSTISRFPGYLQDLLQFDAIAAVSETARASLLEYWRWLGASNVPPVKALTLGIEAAPARSSVLPLSAEPTVLCVASIEGRKNHGALLEACEKLWATGTRFQLRLVGLANAETGGAALTRIASLKNAGRPIRYDGPETDAGLEEAYATCAFTVYPSLAEGFGLPVAESLARGKPCACRFSGAMGEIAAGGGCTDIGDGQAAGIAAALGALLGSPSALETLAAQARGRRFKTWPEYVAEFRDWMGGLSRNP
jgi:glycosyltransferase involved in cell wall biosynthesis